MEQALAKIKSFLDAQVENHSIYVWGARGQDADTITESWIRAKEASCQCGKYADAAVSSWRAAVVAGYGDVLKAYDCSGLASAAMMHAGVADKRRDCDGIWSRCERIAAVEDGALLFRVNDENAEDETHVGFYFGGYQYHAAGRADGVVRERYNPSYWHKIGWYKTMPRGAAVVTEADAPAGEADDFAPPYVVITFKKGRVRVRDFPQTGKTIYIASEGERLPYGEVDADTGWYCVETPKGCGFITPKERYVKLVT